MNAVADAGHRRGATAPVNAAAANAVHRRGATARAVAGAAHRRGAAAPGAAVMLVALGACVAPVEVDVRGRIAGADRLLVATVSEGGGVSAWLVAPEPDVVLELGAGEVAYLWPIDTRADLASSTGGPLEEDLRAGLHVSADGVESTPLPDDRSPPPSGIGACRRCVLAAREMPQRLFAGDSCPAPSWIAPRAIAAKGPSTALGDPPAPAAVLARVRLEVPGACACDATVPAAPEGAELRLEPVTRTEDPWPARAVVPRDDGATAILSERSHLLVDRSGGAAVSREPSDLGGPVIGAALEGDGFALLVLRPGTVIEPVLRRLGPRLEDRGERALASAREPGAVRSFPSVAGVFVLGRGQVLSCTSDACEDLTREGIAWADGAEPREPFRELLRMPDGTLAAVTPIGEVAFGTRAGTRPGASWRWRGTTTLPSARCASAAVCPGDVPVAPTSTVTARRLGAHLVLCGAAALGSERHASAVWERTVAADPDPRAEWTIVAASRDRRACEEAMLIPAGGGAPESLLLLPSSGAALELVETAGALVPRAPVSPPDFGFGAPPAAVESAGAHYVAIARDGRISRAERRRGARFERIAGPATAPDSARWSGPVLDAGDHFVVVGAGGALSRVSVPASGAIDVAGPTPIPALAGCDVTGAARDPASGEILIAGWRTCPGPCAVESAGCPGPWLFRAREDGTGAAVPLAGTAGAALRGNPIDVVVAAGPGEIILASMGPHVLRWARGELTVLEGDISRPGGGSLPCPAPLLSPRIDRAARPGADLWRSASAAFGVVWLGGCDRVAARVTAGRLEQVGASEREPEHEHLTTTFAFCPDHAAWVAKDASGAGSAWEALPQSAMLARWGGYAPLGAGLDSGTPIAAAGARVFFRDDATRTAHRSSAGSIVEIGRNGRAFHPVAFRFAASSAGGATLVTADDGRLFAIRP